MNTKSAVTERSRAKLKNPSDKKLPLSRLTQVFTSAEDFSNQAGDFALFQGGCESLLAALPEKARCCSRALFDRLQQGAVDAGLPAGAGGFEGFDHFGG
jgi:hypothetical protein